MLPDGARNRYHIIMNPIVFALRHPITVMVGIVAIILGSGLTLSRIKIDIFPSLNTPVIYICQPYGGLDPAQVEGLLTNYYEFHFLYVSGVQRIESKNMQGMALLKVYFHAGTDMAQAMGEVVASVNRARFMMPPGTVPPFVTRFDTGSAAVGYLVLSSQTKSIKEIQDLATLRVRPSFANIPGISTPPAFGGNQRAIIVNLDPNELRNLNLSPDDVIQALNTGNLVVPAGNARIKDRLYLVPTNSMVGTDPKTELGNIAVTAGPNPRFLKDIVDKERGIEDGSDITAGYALVNGRRSVFMLVTKRADASTLAVVGELQKALPYLREQVPEDVQIDFAFDQSPTVREAIWGVAFEALLGAVLTGVMVLFFLRDWRTVIVVVLNIPLAVLSALIALWICGHTLNLMTLGGLALAIGILVDEATVEVENIHTQMAKTDSIARAVRLGNSETAVPRLLAMLCILAVFIPSGFMEGGARALFVPLSLAVGFSMIASYLLSSTFVPVMSVWLLKKHSHGEHGPHALQRFYSRLVSLTLRTRYLLVPIYFAICALVIVGVGSRLGIEIFPKTDRGQFQIRLRAPTGTRIDWTERLCQEALRLIEKEVGTGQLELSVGYVGTSPSNYPVQGIYQWASGPEEAYLKIAIRPEAGIRIEELKSRLRAKLPDELRQWLREEYLKEGLTESEMAQRLPNLRTSFEPADIINEVMSFGSPNQVEVSVFGPNIKETLPHAQKVKAEMEKIPALRDLQIVQPQDYPIIEVRTDRIKAGLSGVSIQDISRSLLATTSSSRYVLPNYWRDPSTGQGYIVQVQMPVAKVDSISVIEMMPIRSRSNHGYHANPEMTGMNGGFGGHSLLLRDVAVVRESTMPGQIDRYNMRRMISIVANIEGNDLNQVSKQVQQAVKRAGPPPRGATVLVRGQLEPLDQIFEGLSLGLILAVVTIALLLLAYFQSIRLALISVSAVPASLTGVVLMLYLTQTTLNLQSFIGAIMSVGVVVANAILLVTFAEKWRREGNRSATEAALLGGTGRVRPILMTAGAMGAGMIPMALGFGEGGDAASPLGRAVLGGIIMATAATLLVLPAVFAIVQAGANRQSASLDPDDPSSRYYHPTSSQSNG